MTRTGTSLKEMERELARLRRRLASLEKRVAAGREGGGVTCRSLSVVDAQGRQVAGIDSKGVVHCPAAWIAPDPQTRGVYIDGRQGSVQCLRMSVLGRAGNKELVEISGAGNPRIVLRTADDDAGVRLQAFGGQGGIVHVANAAGGYGILMLASGPSNFIEVAADALGGGRVILDVSHVRNGDGVVYTQDHQGSLTGQFPACAGAKLPKPLRPRELRKRAGRSSTT